MQLDARLQELRTDHRHGANFLARRVGVRKLDRALVRTVRAECLDWLLILGRRHLEHALRRYVTHYNAEPPTEHSLSSHPQPATKATGPPRTRSSATTSSAD